MFGSATRGRMYPAARSSTTAHFPAPIEAARLAAAAFWIIVLGVLFAGWLTSGNSARMRAWKRDLASDCVSLGRGGARCPERAANDKAAGGQSSTADDCAALGKGGHVCFGRAVAEKGAD